MMMISTLGARRREKWRALKFARYGNELAWQRIVARSKLVSAKRRAPQLTFSAMLVHHSDIKITSTSHCSRSVCRNTVSGFKVNNLPLDPFCRFGRRFGALPMAAQAHNDTVAINRLRKTRRVRLAPAAFGSCLFCRRMRPGP